jgi:lipid A 3-O-deacylase
MSHSNKLSRTLVRIAAASLILFSVPSLADQPDNRSRWLPTSWFAQAGAGDEDTSAYAIGAAWDWNWSRDYRIGRVTGYTEVAVGRWQTNNNDSLDGERWFTQFGATPVLRLFPSALDGRWFGEIGVGANYITPIYHAGSKHFSTEFNFGDHIALGRILDNERRASLAVRFQHFSNASIEEPNPGENFTQLRYSYRF